jgi:hypothetical protein
LSSFYPYIHFRRLDINTHASTLKPDLIQGVFSFSNLLT